LSASTSNRKDQNIQINRILLTGGSGLVGKTLAPMLKSRYEVTHFDTSDPGDALPYVEGDLRDSSAVADACRSMDAVIHVAGLHGHAWTEAGDDVGFEVNVVGTKNILEGAVKAKVKRVVFTSSIWATGHGTNPPYLPLDENLAREPVELYGLTKIIGEQLCRYASSTHDISSIVLRPGGIVPAEAYGPNQARYLGGAVDVRDVAQAHVLALEAPADIQHDVFIITTDSPLCRVDPDKFRDDPAAALENVVPGVAELAAKSKLRLSSDMEWYTVQKAKQVLGYKPKHNFTITG
jgi:nucleoside-diphosphate-sugar epimerase